MKTFTLLCAFLLAFPSFAADTPALLITQILNPDAKSAASERAADFETALARAKANGKDIAVLQYGSDWNPASLSLFQNAWNKDAFLKELGPGFVVLAIDNPEVVGGRAVYGRCTAEKCGLTGYSETAIGSAPPLRLETFAKTEPPANEVTAVTSIGGAAFAKRTDGTFIADAKSANPAQDTLTLTVKPGKAGNLLRLDFPRDDTLPSGGPGRTGNGNAVISEIELTQNGKPVKAEWAWGSINLGNNFGPWHAIDGNAAHGGEGWNLHGGQRQRRTLLLTLKQPVAAGADLSIKLVCKSQWGSHVPGAVRAAVLADAATVADVRAVAEAQTLQFRNRAFTFAGWGKMPRLSLFDAEGRPVGANPSLSIRMSAADLAKELKTMRSRREQRDALWSKAQWDKALAGQGPAKAQFLRQGLDVMNFGRDPEFGRHNGWGTGPGGPYEAVAKAMKEYDPKDESGATRWLGFSQGAWGGLPWTAGNEWWKPLENKPQPTAADYAAADACIQREFDDPRNKFLENDHRQHILKARYDLYMRQAGGNHEDDKVLAVQRQIAALDPTTFWGVGAVGYLGMYRRSEQPFLTYGFNAKHQTKAGAHSWTLADAWKEVDHAGNYRFSIHYGGGAGALKITRVAVVLNGKEIGSGKPAAGEEMLDAAHRAVAIPFVCAAFPAGSKVVLKVDYEAKDGSQELIGGFGVEPVLVEE